MNWIPPSGWAGPTPALYYSFDTTNELNLMTGMEQCSANPLVSGKVKYIKENPKQKVRTPIIICVFWLALSYVFTIFRNYVYLTGNLCLAVVSTL